MCVLLKGTSVHVPSSLRSALLLHRHHYHIESHFWCDHRHVRRSETGEARKRLHPQKHMLHMWPRPVEIRQQDRFIR